MSTRTIDTSTIPQWVEYSVEDMNGNIISSTLTENTVQCLNDTKKLVIKIISTRSKSTQDSKWNISPDNWFTQTCIVKTKNIPDSNIVSENIRTY